MILAQVAASSFFFADKHAFYWKLLFSNFLSFSSSGSKVLHVVVKKYENIMTSNPLRPRDLFFCIYLQF